MKKIYRKPKIIVKLFHGEQMLAVSGVISNNGISYGGVDEEGSLEAEVKADNFAFSWE